MTEETFMLIASVLGADTIGLLSRLDKEGKLDERTEFTEVLQVCGEQAVRVLSLPQGSKGRKL